MRGYRTDLIFKIIYYHAIFLKYFVIIIPLGVIILEIISLIRIKIYTPKIIKIFKIKNRSKKYKYLKNLKKVACIM